MPSKNAHKKTPHLKSLMKWRLGDININHLRFILHSLSLYGKEQAVYSSKISAVDVSHRSYTRLE